MRNTWIRFLFGAALLPVVGGCLSVPEPESSTIPWKPPAGAQKPDEVWAAVRARKPDLSRPLALADLADMALENNPASRRAWNDARAAAEQVRQARGYFLPTLIGTASLSRQRTDATPEGSDQDVTRNGAGIQVNYLVLSFGGGRRAAVEAALQTVYASDFALNQSIQDILYAVEAAYYGLISAQAGVAAADASLKDAQTTLDVAQERMAAGLGTELDVLQAQASVDQALYNLAGAQGLINTARGRLAGAAGLPADTPLQTAEPTVEVPEALAEPEMKRLIDDALRRRADISSLRAALAAREAAAKATGSGLWPSLYLNGSINRDYLRSSGDIKYPDNDWSYGGGLSLQWTLFDGLQTLSAERAVRAQAESVRAQLQQAELAASADVWIRYQNYDTALQRYRFSAALLKSATASYDLALDSYKAGLKSILDLLNAESRLAQARSQHIAARQDAFTALAGLAYATGLLEKGGSAQAQDRLRNPEKKENP